VETESYLSEGPLPPFTIIAKSGASATASKQAAIEAAIDYLSFVGLVRR
jgi:N-formylglutamate amidohydrolase